MRPATIRGRRIVLRKVEIAEMPADFALPQQPQEKQPQEIKKPQERPAGIDAQAITLGNADGFRWFHLRLTLFCASIFAISSRQSAPRMPRPEQ
jgi:hypothetical protein